ncbi:DUF3592 domain-containing protein [Fulvivirga sp. M361]|uniref:DUF3592 domain-containing protein n=1 Tax=Fulvivirga sp. M361 TaxID=2594266 RepID=UPI00117A09AA|nr:DUF3592 domain-containing protein [Fulvivirga sp. M361]TRX48921.1 DUF3592 domain-containing protein [Fulvivirga sp. M361]
MAVTDQEKQHVRALLVKDKKIEAIKYVSDNFNLGLKDAQKLVELIDDDIEDHEYVRRSKSARLKTSGKRSTKSSGKGASKMVGVIFSLVGIVMLSIAINDMVTNQELANIGITVTATVVEDPYQPTFEYVVNGDTLYYYSSTSSDPPSYHLGEEVEMFVHPENPYNTLVNTFMERWFLGVLLGGMGAVFFTIGIVSFVVFRKI